MNCRGKETRRKIIQNYEIKPIAHIKLISGRKVRSDAGHEITDSYYIFDCKHRITGEKDVIQCGEPVAKDFLELIQSDPLPIFNPISEDGKLCVDSINLRNRNAKTSLKKWNLAAKQLYNAIMILIVAWDAKPNTPLFKMKEDSEKYYGCTPYISRIKPINNILKSKNLTISNVIEKLSENNNLKKYEFNLLNDILESQGEKSFLI